MFWQTLRLTESMLLLSTFRDLHILGMHIFCFVDSRNTINLSKKQRLCCVLYELRFQSIEFNSFHLFSLWFPKHCEQLFHLELCFYDVMQLNRALVPSLLMALLKGVYPSRGPFWPSSWSHLPLYCPHRCAASPEVAFGYSFLPWDACIFSAYACSSGSVFPDISLSLFSLFSFLLSMVCIILVLHIFGLFVLLELVICCFSFGGSLSEYNTLLDIDAEMIEQLIWVKEQIFLEIFFPFIILKLKLLELKCILKTLNISTWFLKDSCAE